MRKYQDTLDIIFNGVGGRNGVVRAASKNGVGAIKTVKASLISILIALALSACSSQWDKQAILRSWNTEGVKNIRSVDWTVFQQALHPRYVKEAALAQENTYWD